MKKMFISESTSTEIIDGQEVAIKYIALANSVVGNRAYAVPGVAQPGAKPEESKIININFDLKAYKAEEADAITFEKVAQKTDVEIKSFSENVQIDLMKIPVPVLDLKKFKNAGELNEAIENYHFEQGLKTSAYGLIKWIEKA